MLGVGAAQEGVLSEEGNETLLLVLRQFVPLHSARVLRAHSQGKSDESQGKSNESQGKSDGA